MTVVLGLLLGVGLVMTIAPRLWPVAPSAERRPGILAALAVRLAQAGLGRQRPELVLVVSGLTAAAVGVVAVAATGVPALGIVAAIAAGSAPVTVVISRARRRQADARRAWPDLIDHLVAGIRAGVPLPDAIVALADVGPELTRAGFREFERSLRTRGSLAEALAALRDELADPVADRVVAGLLIAREVGGTGLPGILRGLARSIRLEMAARGETAARQSWVVAAARLGVAAPWAVVVVLATRPEAEAVYATPGGTALLLGGFAVTVVAYRIMLRIGRLPEETRWLA